MPIAKWNVVNRMLHLEMVLLEIAVNNDGANIFLARGISDRAEREIETKSATLMHSLSSLKGD